MGQWRRNLTCGSASVCDSGISWMYEVREVRAIHGRFKSYLTFNATIAHLRMLRFITLVNISRQSVRVQSQIAPTRQSQRNILICPMRHSRQQWLVPAITLSCDE